MIKTKHRKRWYGALLRMVALVAVMTGLLYMAGCAMAGTKTGIQFEYLDKISIGPAEVKLYWDTTTKIVYMVPGQGGISPYVVLDSYGQPTVGIWDKQKKKIVPAELDVNMLILEEDPDFYEWTEDFQG